MVSPGRAFRHLAYEGSITPICVLSQRQLRPYLTVFRIAIASNWECFGQFQSECIETIDGYGFNIESHFIPAVTSLMFTIAVKLMVAYCR